MKLLFETIDLEKRPRRIDLVIPEGCLWAPPADFFLGDRNIYMQLGTKNPKYTNVKVTILKNDEGKKHGKRNN
jgi:hypothetical protein